MASTARRCKIRLEVSDAPDLGSDPAIWKTTVQSTTRSKVDLNPGHGDFFDSLYSQLKRTCRITTKQKVARRHRFPPLTPAPSFLFLLDRSMPGAAKNISSVLPSVRPSVRPSVLLSFRPSVTQSLPQSFSPSFHSSSFHFLPSFISFHATVLAPYHVLVSQGAETAVHGQRRRRVD
jgi:hypothetical protein